MTVFLLLMRNSEYKESLPERFLNVGTVGLFNMFTCKVILCVRVGRCVWDVDIYIFFGG